MNSTQFPLLNTLIVLLFLLFQVSLNSQIIWLEDFSYPNGLTTNPPTWTTNFNDCDDLASLNLGNNWWGTFNGEFRVLDIEGFNCTPVGMGNGGDNQNTFTTELIDISAYDCVTASVDVRSVGPFECNFPSAPSSNPVGFFNGHDQLVVEYSIDGGAWTIFPTNGYYCGDTGLPATSSTNNLSGNSIQIRITVGNQANDEEYFFDDITITNTSTTPALNPIGPLCGDDSPVMLSSTEGGFSGAWSGPGVSGGNFSPGIAGSGSHTLTFTPNPGQCANPNTTDVTVNTTPTANPAGPLSQCDNGSNQGTFNLTILHSVINPGPVTINWYSNMAATMSISSPGAYLSGATTVYATVDNGSCTSAPLPVNLNILTPPTASDATLPALCDQGGGQATFNLTNANNMVNGNPGVTISWFSDPAATMAIGTPNAYMSGSGFAYATVSDGSCNSSTIAQITLTVNSLPQAFSANAGACDQGGGMGTFDLTSVNSTVNGNTTNAVNWFSDAAGMNSILFPGNFPSSTGTVYAHVDDGTCTSNLVPVDLSVTPPPTANPASLEGCDQGGGQFTFDLTNADNEVSGGLGTVTYYLDAAATMLINTPTNYTTTTTTVFATVTVGTCTSSTAPVTLTVHPAPTANPAMIQACVPSGNQATFDLTSVDNDVNGGTGETVNWYTDAAATMPIGTPDAFPSVSTTVFATVDNGNCESSSVAVMLTVSQEPTANNQTLSACDEGGAMATFDLTSAINAITGGEPSTVDFFEDITALIQINNPSAYNSITATVYGFVTGSNGCPGGPALIDLIIDPLPSAFPTSIMECDEGGLAATFNLPDENEVVNGGTGNTVNWYTDAAGNDPIANPAAFFTTATTVFASVFDGSCEGPTAAIQLNIQENPMSVATSLSACDEGTGEGTFDLLSLDNVVNGGTGAPVSWFLDVGLNNPVPNPDAFVSGSTTVFAIVTEGGCSSAPVAIGLTVEAGNFANPAASDLCDQGGNQAIFDLTTLNQTVNGNTGNSVNWYFDGAATSPINNPDMFTSGPATVYATVVSGVCESATVEVVLSISPTPSANASSLSECDAGGNIAFFNLTDADNDVNGNTGNTVLWYSDPGGNMSIVNTTNFSSGNSTVFARVSDGICESQLVAVSLMILPAPAAFPTQLSGCDEGGNLANFDLTEADMAVNGATLNAVSWFQDDQGLFPVANPNTFPSGPTSVYASVSNGTCNSPLVEVTLTVNSGTPANSTTLNACDEGNGQAIFNLTQADPIVNGGTGIAVNWYADALGNIQINNTTNFNSGTTTIFASTDNGVCESNPVAINLTVTSPPEVNASISMEISCTNFNDGAIDLDITGGSDPFIFDWNDNDLDGIEDPTNLSSGLYEVTVTDNNGCTAITSIILDEPDELFLVCSRLSPILSENGNEGVIGLVFNGGTPPYSIEWMGPVNGTQTENMPGMISITGLTAGTYTITITDDAGCQTDCIVTLEPFACNLSLDASVQVGPCGEPGSGMIDLMIINGTPPYDFNWNDNSLDGQEDPSGLTSGIYRVTVTDGNNCVDSLSIFVGQGVPLSLSCDELNPVSASGLEDGQAEIAFSGGMNPYTISWSGPSPGSQMVNTVGVYVLNDLGAGNYLLTITDDVGCTIDCDFVINDANCNLDVTYTTMDISCPGDTDGTIDLMITGTEPVTIDWDEDIYDGMEDLTDLSSGLYLVQVTDADGCSDNLSIPVNQPGNILINCSVTSTVTTPGGTDGTAAISFMGGTGPYTLNWDGPVSGSQVETDPGILTLLNLSAGEYTVTLVDANNCMGSCSFTMNEPPCGIFLSIFGQNPPCDPINFGFIDLTIMGGQGPLTIDWNEDIYDGMEDLFGVEAGTYIVTVSDTTGCEATTSITLNLPPSVEVTCGEFNPASLGGSDGQAEINFAGGTGPYSIFWLGPVIGNRIEQTGGTIIISDLPAGTYDIIVSDANFCESTCTFNITETNCTFAIIDTIQNITCFGESDGEINLTINGTNPPFDFDWEDDSLDGMNQVGGLAEGEYTVTVIDNGNCSEEFTFLITQPEVLDLTCDMLNPVSMSGAEDGEAIVVFSGGTPPFVLDWTGPVSGNQMEVSAGSTTISNLAPGDYDLMLTDSNMCSLTCMFTITSPICDLLLEIEGTDISCDGAQDGRLALTINNGTEPYEINWNEDDLNGMTEGSNLSEGTYSVTVTDALGCSGSTDITIIEPPLLELICSEFSPVSTPGANDGVAQVELIGGTPPFTMEVLGPVTTSLMPDIPDIYQVSSLLAGDYMVMVTDSNNCIAECIFTITESGCPLNLEVSGTNLTCNGSEDGTIDLVINNGILPFNINWNVDMLDGQADQMNLAAGTYSVTVTDGQSCVDTISIQITEPEALDITCSESSPASTTGGNDGEASIDFSGGTAPYTLEWSGPVSGVQTEMAAGMVLIGNLEAGLYDLIITDDNGCEINCGFTITDPNCTLNLMLQSTATSCPGTDDGSINLTIVNGNGVPDINWDNDNLDGIEDPDGLSPGSYNVTVTDALGCEASGSVIVNEGNQIPVAEASAGGVVCLGDCFTFNVTFTGQAPFVLDYEVVSTNGSPIPLTLNNDTEQGTITICPAIFGLSVGTLDVNFLNLTDAICQTTLSQTEQLELVGSSTAILTPTICPEESILFNGTVYDINSPSGTETLVDANQFGCDSIVEINLNFFPEAIGTLDEQLCPGNSVVINGNIYDEITPSGTEILPNASANGCDSTININLSFFNIATGSLTSTLCPGESLVVNGTTYNEANPSGTEILVGAASTGCDSIIEVMLSFFPISEENFATTLCPGENVVINGTTYDETNPIGSETLVDASSNGCDSIINVELSFFPDAVADFNTTLCEGESITFNGTIYDVGNPSGVEVLSNASINGCDSTVNVSISFFEPAMFDFITTVCEDETIIFNGTPYNQNNPSGTEILTGASSNGCDSIVNITLSFFEPAMSDFNPTVCENETIIFNGTPYNQNNPSGTEILTGASSNGCDSIVNITLSFFEPAMSDFNPTVCENETIIFNGTPYNQNNPSGIEIITGASVFGCDSIVNINLSFFEPAMFDFNPTICEGETIIFNGTPYDQNNPSGTEILTGASSNGCDSIVNITLSFFEPAMFDFNTTVCEGESIIFNGTTYDQNNPSGTEILTGASSNGCDSIVNVNVSIIEEVTTLLDPVLCPGEAVEVNGQIYDENMPSGMETIAGGSVLGCDSVITIELQYLEESFTNIQENLCFGESLTVNGMIYDQDTPAGTETLLAMNGCDSIISIELSFYEEASGVLEMTLCSGESLVVNGTEYNEATPSGTEIIPNGSVNGCDSIIQVSLSFNSSIMGTMVSGGPICAGASTTITFELSGADSYEIAYYSDDINNPTILTDIFDGHSITVSPDVTTIYNFNYILGITNAGIQCESDTGTGVTIEVSDLSIGALVTSDYNGFDVSCTGAADGAASAETVGGIGPFNFEWSTGATSAEIFDLTPGTYDITITDATGCNAVTSVVIEDSPGIAIESSAISPDCFDESAGTLIIDDFIGGIGPFEYSLDGEFFQNIPNDLPFSIGNIVPGNYTLLIQDVNDCQGEQIVNVPEAEELVVTLGVDTIIQLGDSIFLDPQANFNIASIKWNPVSDLSNPESAQTFTRPFETINYQFTAFDSLGCSASTSITIIVQKEDRVYIPNIFSPNGDGDNDVFMIFSGDDVLEVARFMIFDRWGNLLFDEGPFAPNVPQFGWDGTYRGQKMNSGVYVYFAEVVFVDGRTDLFKGDVVLMR